MLVTFKSSIKFVKLVNHIEASIFGLHLNGSRMIYHHELYKYPNHHSTVYEEQYNTIIIGLLLALLFVL